MYYLKSVLRFKGLRDRSFSRRTHIRSSLTPEEGSSCSLCLYVMSLPEQKGQSYCRDNEDHIEYISEMFNLHEQKVIHDIHCTPQ